MKLSTRIILGLAVAGAVLCSPTSAGPAQAQSQTAITVNLGISCQGSGVQGITEGVMGDPSKNPTSFRITCSPETPQARTTISAVGDPEDMPWSVQATTINVHGVSTSCTQRGTRLPMKISCNSPGHGSRYL